jgi:hypothetical protein
VTADLLMQPRAGTLTRITDAVRHPRTGMLGVWVLCACGAFVFIARGIWLNGRRPERCLACSIKRTRVPLVHVNQRGAIVPFHKVKSA